MGSEQKIAAIADTEPHRHLLTVDDFLVLDGAGAFEGLGRVELLEGEIFVMAPLYFPHARVALELTVAIGLAVRDIDQYEAATPVSAELGDHSLPEADIVVVRKGGGDRFVTLDVAQIFVEVSVSSLQHDLGPKLRLYARHGVPEYWVADVDGRTIIRFHAPQGEEYTQRTEFAFGRPVPSATIPGLTVDTARLA